MTKSEPCLPFFSHQFLKMFSNVWIFKAEKSNILPQIIQVFRTLMEIKYSAIFVIDNVHVHNGSQK